MELHRWLADIYFLCPECDIRAPEGDTENYQEKIILIYESFPNHQSQLTNRQMCYIFKQSENTCHYLHVYAYMLSIHVLNILADIAYAVCTFN